MLRLNNGNVPVGEILLWLANNSWEMAVLLDFDMYKVYLEFADGTTRWVPRSEDYFRAIV